MSVDPRKFKELLLQAPPEQLDESMFPLIRKWDENPKPIQVLEVLDQCIHCSLASGFTVKLLQMMYDNALTLHKEEHADVVQKATWRKDPAK